jgi:ribosomal-protein-alanine N-acetyltransferase
MKLAWATPGDAAALAAAHAEAFDEPWTASAFDDLFAGPGVFGLLAEEDARRLGMILCRVAAGEMEVLTIGVTGAARRGGVARALMAAALAAGRQAGAESVFLEVAVGNAAAIGLYRRLGFAQAGVRRGYYDRGPAGREDALVMHLDLNTVGA